MFGETPKVSRRTFVKTSGALGALAAAGGVVAADQVFHKSEQAFADTVEKTVWSQCNINCGGRCVFRYKVKDDAIMHLETDNIGDPEGLQARACLRGRSIRRWINSPDRLQHPMKRVGKRGEGKFEQISWDEATTLIADNLKRVIDKYGNEAVFITYATGMYSATGRTAERLLNCVGGYLNMYNDYSTNMMSAAIPYLYGESANPYDNVYASSFSEAANNSDLVVMFGNSPADTRMGGANAVWDFTLVREAGPRIVNIDYRLNETSSGHASEWLPIRPGTDAALVSAIAHEWIKNNQVDLDFLHTYCVGYDEETMPESAKGQNKSYRAYIMGEGYDKIAKTPEWAAPITQIPAARIRELAKEIADAKAPYICQGWGPQRHSNGESATRAICMLAILIGQIGLPGTNTGMREAEPGTDLAGGMPSGDNPVETAINCYQWLNAVDHGEEMTALNAGVKGADKLSTGIKFIWNYAGNCLTNQHADVNLAHDILQDESKCEFIVVSDTVMNDSAKYADVLLPDAMRAEQLNMSGNGYSEYYLGVCVGGPAQSPKFNCRPSYEVNAEIAEKLGVRDKFTEGKTEAEWIQSIYEGTVEKQAAEGLMMPSWNEIKEGGFFKKELEPAIGLADFRSDPVANKLDTPSGKIEIYSEALAEIADTWELKEGEVISPIPIFDPGIDGYGSTTDEFPLYSPGFHYKSRAHSSFGVIKDLEHANRQQMWISEIDAKERGIKTGDMCSVKSAAGEIHIEAKVTPRIIPGTIGIPQGAWHDANMAGDRIDKGACVNTLTTYRPTPLAKGNGVHSVVAQVAKV